jgi:hypothetical protein
MLYDTITAYRHDVLLFLGIALLGLIFPLLKRGTDMKNKMGTNKKV